MCMREGEREKMSGEMEVMRGEKDIGVWKQQPSKEKQRDHESDFREKRRRLS